jgi:hypothetical protein
VHDLSPQPAGRLGVDVHDLSPQPAGRLGVDVHDLSPQPAGRLHDLSPPPAGRLGVDVHDLSPPPAGRLGVGVHDLSPPPAGRLGVDMYALTPVRMPRRPDACVISPPSANRLGVDQHTVTPHGKAAYPLATVDSYDLSPGACSGPSECYLPGATDHTGMTRTNHDLFQFDLASGISEFYKITKPVLVSEEEAWVLTIGRKIRDSSARMSEFTKAFGTARCKANDRMLRRKPRDEQKSHSSNRCKLELQYCRGAPQNKTKRKPKTYVEGVAAGFKKAHVQLGPVVYDLIGLTCLTKASSLRGKTVWRNLCRALPQNRYGGMLNPGTNKDFRDFVQNASQDTIHGCIAQPTAQVTIEALGSRTSIGEGMYRPGEYVSIKNIIGDEWYLPSHHRKIALALCLWFKERKLPVGDVVLQTQIGSNLVDQLVFRARCGFKMLPDREAFRSHLDELSLLGKEAKFTFPTSVSLTKMTFMSATLRGGGIDRILLKIPFLGDFAPTGVALVNKLEKALIAVLWGDAVKCLLCCKFWLVDVEEKFWDTGPFVVFFFLLSLFVLFAVFALIHNANILSLLHTHTHLFMHTHTGRSEVHPLQDIIDGENNFKHYVHDVIADLTPLREKGQMWAAGNMNIHMEDTVYVVADHHFHGETLGKPAGISDARDHFGDGPARNFCLVASDGESVFQILVMRDMFVRVDTFKERALQMHHTIVQLAEQELKDALESNSAERIAAAKLALKVEGFGSNAMALEAIITLCNSTVGRFNRAPIWINGRDGGLYNAVGVPPSMHDTYNVLARTLQAVVRLLHKDAPGYSQWLYMFEGLEGLSKTGKCVQSFARCRRLMAAAWGFFLPDILAHKELAFRIYAHALTMGCWISRHIYSRHRPDPKARLRFRFSAIFNFILVTGLDKNTTRSLYFRMMTQHMPNFEEMFRLKWLWLIEEGGEASFRSYNQFTEAVGRQTDLSGFREWETRAALLYDVQNVSCK